MEYTSTLPGAECTRTFVTTVVNCKLCEDQNSEYILEVRTKYVNSSSVMTYTDSYHRIKHRVSILYSTATKVFN